MITFHELPAAVQRLSTGRVPGIDGLPAQFDKHFWSILGRDFYEVICECFERGTLPTSCQRAVIPTSKKRRSGIVEKLGDWYL